ncbi:MAG: argininosuccinate lyase, partial [Anaerolineae bacterium]|nr:argininosuccinate lyase [Anaerolineae bacterium]
GDLVGLLVTLKGLPSTYNKDLQEDKEAIFDALDTLLLALPVMAGVIRTFTVHPERMRAALTDEMLATELADYLVQKGVPFREAHRLVGQVVRRALASGCSLRELPLDEYRAVCQHFSPDVMEWLDCERAVERRSSVGGTARQAVLHQLVAARQLLEASITRL